MKYRGLRWSRDRADWEVATYMPGYIIRVPNWEPKNAHDKAPLRCPRGHDFERACYDIRKGRGCLECIHQDLRLKQGKEFYNNLKFNNYTPLFIPDEYANNRKRMPVLCPNGEVYMVSKDKFINEGNRCICPECNKKRGTVRTYRTPYEVYQEMLKQGERLLEHFRGVNVPTLSMCIECGHVRKLHLSKRLKRGKSCAKCSQRHSPSTAEYRQQIAVLKWELEEGEEYKGVDVAIRHICPKGHRCITRPRAVRRGKGCKECSRAKQSRDRQGINPTTGKRLTEEEQEAARKKRQDAESKRWRDLVKVRDGHKCVLCGSTDTLESHHLYDHEHHDELRTVLENGVTLCWEHHQYGPRSFHAKYGLQTKTTAQDFLKYLDEYISFNPDADKDRLLRLRERVKALIEQVDGPKDVKYEQLSLWRKEAEAHAI